MRSRASGLTFRFAFAFAGSVASPLETAQRFLCASAIRFRSAGLRVRFLALHPSQTERCHTGPLKASWMISKSPGAILALCSIACLGTASGEPNDAGYRLLKKITLGGEGGWDYFDVDPETGHVFIPRGTHILVVTAQGGRVADIPNVHGAHAIAFAPELKKAFLSTESSVTILDMGTIRVVSEVQLPGKDPDAILYDAFSKRVFTFNGGGTEDASAIDAQTGKVLGSIPLGGKPETAQADGAGHVFVNVERKNRIVAFDSKTLRRLHTWPIAPCEEPAGLAIDVAHKRLFAGCHNEKMAVVDATNGKVVAMLPVGNGIDANRFDPGLGWCSHPGVTVPSRWPMKSHPTGTRRFQRSPRRPELGRWRSTQNRTTSTR